MADRRVIRDGASVSLETAFAHTGKMDGGAAEAFKVPQKAKRLRAIEVCIAAESLAAVQENVYGLRLQGDGLPGGPYYYVLGGHSSGTTSTAGMIVPVTTIPVDLPVVPGATIDADGFAVGDTIIVATSMLALVFEE